MSTRYLSNLALTLLAGFLVVATQAFTLTAVSWITFGVAVGALLLSAAIVLVGRSRLHRAVGVLAGAISAWTIVASLVFAPATVMWLGFASAVALVALGVAGLAAHELRTERVVHSLQVERDPALV